MDERDPGRSRPALYTIPVHRAFADALALGLIRRFGGDTLGLARGLVHCLSAKAELRRQVQRLRFALGIQLRGDGADDARLEVQLAKDGADFLDGQGRLIEVEINDVVVAIDFIAQAGDSFEFVIQLENFFQVPDSRGVDFDFDHKIYFVTTSP